MKTLTEIDRTEEERKEDRVEHDHRGDQAEEGSRHDRESEVSRRIPVDDVLDIVSPKGDTVLVGDEAGIVID